MGQWRTRLRGIETISATEAGVTDHRQRAEQMAREAEIEDVRQRALQTIR